MARQQARRQSSPFPNTRDDRISDLDRRVATIEATLEGVAAGVEDLRNREAAPTNWLAFLVAASIIGAGGALYMDTRLKPTETAVDHISVLSTDNAQALAGIEAATALTERLATGTASNQASMRERIAALEATIRATTRQP